MKTSKADWECCERCGNKIFPGKGFVFTDGEGDTYFFHDKCHPHHEREMVADLDDGEDIPFLGEGLVKVPVSYLFTEIHRARVRNPFPKARNQGDFPPS